MFATIVTPTSTTTYHFYAVASRLTPGRPKKTNASSAKVKGVAKSSFLKRKLSIHSKEHYTHSSQPAQDIAIPTYEHHKHYRFDSQSTRSSSTSSTKSYTPHLSLISLEEASKRPELTKKLYLGDEDKDKHCAPSYSTADLEQRFPHATLISLEEAAARPELTKRILFM